MVNPVNVASNAVSGTVSLFKRPIFWFAAAVVVMILIGIVLYVSSARNYALAKLQARAITTGDASAPAAPTVSDNPTQPEPVAT